MAMTVLLAVYGRKGYAQYRLPPMKNADYSLWLSSEVFRMEQPLRIFLENVDDSWFILSSDTYYPEDARKGRRRIGPGDRFELVSAGGDRYIIHVSEAASLFVPFEKYRTRHSMSIGRSPENDIILTGRSGVSRLHARILRGDSGWRIESKGINGLYVNDCFVDGGQALCFGDHLNIMGQHMVFLTDYLAVEAGEGRVQVQLDQVSCSRSPAEAAGSRNHQSDQVSAYGSSRASCPDTGPDPVRRLTKRAGQAGLRIIHRSPRSLESVDVSPIELDGPPEPEMDEASSYGMAAVSNILMSLPMAGGSLFMIFASGKEGGGNSLFMYSGLVMSAVSLVTALIWIGIQKVHEGIREKRRREYGRHSYRTYLKEKEGLIRERIQETRRLLEERYVSADHCVKTCSMPEAIWNRTPYHSDFMVCRLGLEDSALPAEIQVPKARFRLHRNPLLEEMYGLRSRYGILEGVPSLISFKEHGQIGLVAAREADRMNLARNIILQFSLNNCYTETKIGLIYDAEGSSYGGWDFLRWLPHVWTEGKDRRLLASGQEEARDLCHHLLSLFHKREEGQGEFLPVYIIFIAESRYLEGEPVEQYLNSRGENYGVLIVWISDERDLLPRSCEFVIECSDSFRGYHDLVQGRRTPVSFDSITDEAAQETARQLSLYRVRESIESNEVPSRVSFFEMLGIENPEDLDIRNHWKKNRVIDSLRAPIGLKAGSKLKYLDIHEKYHGPHGLVAGTTGSGKSELLETYLLSLLILYSPELVNLFLIDYKGGGMAGMFEGVPHLCGQVSNLSGGNIARAMIALRSENQRRQRLFARYQVNHISDYMKLCYEHQEMEALPHLLIVIDEFAELKKEEPDFMQGLISVAQVGRSLGLHLILATQKPGGIVDDTIFSNSRFRMCLRVQEKEDSMDMLHKPDAADIQQTGRCCFQVGNDEIYEIFQAAWAGASYDKKAAQCKRAVSLIRFSGTEISVAAGTGRNKQTAGVEDTQFHVLKRRLVETAEQEGYEKARQLWMEPLPRVLYLSEIAAEHMGSGTNPEEEGILIGLADDPANQRRIPVCFHPDRHTVVCGLPMSGKSTFLQSLLYGMLSRMSPKDIHIYAIDYSSGALKAFEKMPHVGAVITEGQEQRCRACFYHLEHMLDDRKRLFAGGSYLHYRRRRSAGPAASGKTEDIEAAPSIPRVLLIIDNYASFNEKTGQELEGLILRLCREGANAGITLLFTGGGFSAKDIPVSLSEYFKDTFCLEQKEAFSYSEIMGSLLIPVIPEKKIPGRGLCRSEEGVFEFQTALALSSVDDYERIRKISEEADRQREVFYTGEGISDVRQGRNHIKQNLPRPIRLIPDKPAFSDFIKDHEAEELLGNEELPVGYLIKTAEIARICPEAFYCFLITGRRKSGKHSFMKLLIELLKMLKIRKLEGCREREGTPESGAVTVTIIDLQGRLAFFRDDPAIDGYLDCHETVCDYLEGLGQVLQSRKQDIREKKEGEFGTAEAGGRACMNGRAPGRRMDFVLVEDMNSLLSGEMAEEYGIPGFFENVWEKGAGLGVHFISISGAGEAPDSGTGAWRAYLRYGTGLHLGGNLIEDRCFEHSTFSYEAQTVMLPPGAGFLFHGPEKADRILLPSMEA